MPYKSVWAKNIIYTNQNQFTLWIMVVYICQSQCVCKRDSVQLYIHKHNVCSKQNCSKRTLIHYRKHGQNTKGYLAKYIIFFGKNQTILLFFFPNQGSCDDKICNKTQINDHDRYFWCIMTPWHLFRPVCVGAKMSVVNDLITLLSHFLNGQERNVGVAFHIQYVS